MERIREMNSDEIRQLVDWAAEEGWNPGLNDADCFWRLDPEGFLALEEEGQLIGGGAIVRYDESFGFMGLFIVHKSHRCRNLGRKLWYARRDKLLSRLKQGGTIGLDAVDAMIPFYEAGGFRQFARQRRFVLSEPFSGVEKRCPEVVDLQEIDIKLIADFDAGCFPTRREAYLKTWIGQAGAVSLGVVKGDSLKGFGVMRPCLTGWKIGPLFAESSDVAHKLFESFQTKSAGQAIFLDAPDYNPHALDFCKNHQMTEVFGCVRMYNGPVPDLDNDRIFAITTFEVG